MEFSIDSTGHISVSLGAEFLTPLGEFSFAEDISTDKVSDDETLLTIAPQAGGQTGGEAYALKARATMTICVNGHYKARITERRFDLTAQDDASSARILPGDGPCDLSAAQSTAAPAPTRSAAIFTAAEQDLVTKLLPEVWGSCQPRRARENSRKTAVINCRPVNSGTSRVPAIVQFVSRSAMDSWFAGWGTYPSTNSCRRGEGRTFTWNHNGVDEGEVTCSYDKSVSLYTMCWTNTSDNIGVIAQGADPAKLYTWWTKSAYIPDRA